MIKYTVKHDSNLLNVVLEIYKGASRQRAKQIIQFNQFEVNGKTIRNHPNIELKAGDTIEVIKCERTTRTKSKPTKVQPVVLHFEDSYFVVGLKPAGILSCSDGSEYNKHSYHKVLENYLSNRDEAPVHLSVVHRIDREVEGLLIFAKKPQYMERLKDMWPKVTKKYLALTEGKPEPQDGIVENWLRDGHDQVVEAFDKEVKNSRLSKTEYHFVKNEGKYSLLEITLHTGRKNQIRVHLSGLKCPIVGDRKYGADGTYKRQIRLAATTLEFTHPFTKKLVSLKYKPAVHFFHPSQNADEQYKVI